MQRFPFSALLSLNYCSTFHFFPNREVSISAMRMFKNISDNLLVQMSLMVKFANPVLTKEEIIAGNCVRQLPEATLRDTYTKDVFQVCMSTCLRMWCVRYSRPGDAWCECW